MNWYVDLAIAIPALVLGAVAQWWVLHVIAKADSILTTEPYSVQEVAQRMLASAGIHDVWIQELPGVELDDHYDGRTKRIQLSDTRSSSVAALAIAAHEVGHAIQDAEGAVSFRFRTAIAPVAAVASVGWLVLVFIGLFLGLAGLVHLAVILFAAVAVFHLATLPVELGASRRAMELVRGGGLVTLEEERIVRRVLTAAALTYAAAALVSIAQILQLMFLGGED